MQQLREQISTALPAASYWAWIKPDAAGRIRPGECDVFWIGAKRADAVRALPRRVLAIPPEPLASRVLKGGVRLIEIDAEQARNLLIRASAEWSVCGDGPDYLGAATFLYFEWRRTLIESGAVGLGLQNNLKRFYKP